MNLKEMIYNLDYLHCEHEDHFGEQLCRICVDYSCSSQTIICPICEHEQHEDHETVALKHFLSQIATVDSPNLYNLPHAINSIKAM